MGIKKYEPELKVKVALEAIKNRARKNIPLFESFRNAVDSAFL